MFFAACEVNFPLSLEMGVQEGHPEQGAQAHVQVAAEGPQEGDSTASGQPVPSRNASGMKPQGSTQKLCSYLVYNQSFISCAISKERKCNPDTFSR